MPVNSQALGPVQDGSTCWTGIQNRVPSIWGQWYDLVISVLGLDDVPGVVWLKRGFSRLKMTKAFLPYVPSQSVNWEGN